MDCIQLSLFGKTCPEHSAPMEEKISEPCWKNLPAWNNQTLQFLNLRRGADGAKPEQSPETDGLWLGDSLMLNIGESPREESVSLLSQILEGNVPQKYFLSARACQGILTRASRRGKKLPDLLQTALLEMIRWWEERSQGERTGIGIGEDGDPAYTLQANHEHGVCYCIAGNIIDRSETAGANGSGVKENQSYTLNTVDRPAVAYKVFDARGNGDGRTCPTITGDHENRITDYTAIAVERKTFNEQSFSHYKESDKSSTLKAKAGNIGNGSESLVVEKTSIAVDGYNGAVTGEKAASLTCKNDGSHSGPLVAEKTICWIVRRLTPVECERLQGYPDDYTNIGDWTDSKGKKHKYADSPRYKALGNSIALPQWFWLVQRMCPYLKEKPTLGSLFDGIGGFPLVWQRAYGEGTARWASEIEEFPMAVTKRRFGEQ